jgi:hypothetical protein
LCRLALGIIRWGHSGFVYLGRITRAHVSCTSSFSVGGYLRLHMLAGGILLRFRLRAPRGHRRGRWFLLAAEQVPKKFHLNTPISRERRFSPTPRSLSQAISHSNLVRPREAPLPTNGALVPARFHYRAGFAASSVTVGGRRHGVVRRGPARPHRSRLVRQEAVGQAASMISLLATASQGEAGSSEHHL